MSEKIDLGFLKKLQRDVEPKLKPGETAIEYMKRMEAERVASMIQNPPSEAKTSPLPPQPPQQEVIFYEGYKLSRDFFTMLAVSLMKLQNPEVNKIMETFGFEMKDLDGKPLVFRSRRPKRRTRRRND